MDLGTMIVLLMVSTALIQLAIHLAIKGNESLGGFCCLAFGLFFLSVFSVALFEARQESAKPNITENTPPNITSMLLAEGWTQECTQNKTRNMTIAEMCSEGIEKFAKINAQAYGWTVSEVSGLMEVIQKGKEDCAKGIWFGAPFDPTEHFIETTCVKEALVRPLLE